MGCRLLAGVAIALLLHSCAGLKGLPTEPPDWEMIGKLSLRDASGSKVVTIDWRQQGDRSEIELDGPLGVTLARISVSPEELVIDDGHGIQRHTGPVSLQLEDGQSFRLPWRHLRYWIRGRLSDGSTPIAGKGLREGDWLLRVLGEDHEGPRLLLLEHPSLTLRLKVLEWQINAAKSPGKQTTEGI